MAIALIPNHFKISYEGSGDLMPPAFVIIVTTITQSKG